MPVLPASRWPICKPRLQNPRPMQPKPWVTSSSSHGPILVRIPHLYSKMPILIYRTEIKQWADEGSKRNELLAIARKHRAQLSGDAKSAASKASASGESAFGAATSKAGNQYAQATDDAQLITEDAFNSAVSTWSNVSEPSILEHSIKVNMLTYLSVPSQGLSRF
jgi:hypothetical protein